MRRQIILAAWTVTILAAPALAGPGVAPSGMFVAHHVDDYDVWKKAFDDHVSVRIDAGCLGHRVFRDTDDPKLVRVYLPGSSVAKLEQFMESADLRDAMRGAGVRGTPTVTFVTPELSDVDPNGGSAGMIATHAVEDYDAWRTEYDALDDYRRHVGITGHAIWRVAGEPNRVVVYHQAEDLATLRKFVASTVLAEAMQEAGVVGPPDIRFVLETDRAEYPGTALAVRDAGGE